MKDAFFINGRFAWPPVVAIAFVAVIVVATDAVWRTVSMPFETLMILSVVFTAVGLVLILGFARFGRSRPH